VFLDAWVRRLANRRRGLYAREKLDLASLISLARRLSGWLGTTPASPLDTIRQFQSETDAIREAPEPRFARATVATLGSMFLVLILIMCVTRLDRVVSSMGGKIVSAQGVSVLQALDPSIIRSIDVREGDQVEAGQLLATLDPTFAAADVKQLRQQIASLEAQIARDRAQLDGTPLELPQWSDPDLAKYAIAQRAYYDQQVGQYKAQVMSFDAKIRQTQATIAKYQADHARYQQREEVARKVEEMRSILAAHGTGSQLNLYVSQDQRLEMLRTMEFDHNSLVEAQQTLASLTADREAFIQQWSTQLSQDLVTARNNLDTARAQLDKAMKHHELVRLTAAEPSVVLTVAKLSVGSVLKEGDTLLTLMPMNTPVEVEIRVASRDIGFLRPGDRCVLKIEAFNYMEHGTAEGKVRWTSDNAFTLDDDGKQVDAYYKGRCGVDAMHFTNVPAKFRLIPGMTLQADVNVGSRSVAMYLLGGIIRGFSEAMREP
jgi:HlyD family secretion protein